LTSILPRWAAALVATELRLARFAARAPSIIASVRHASASSYSETSKWEGLAILLLVSFLPDAAVLWLLPIPLWGHLAVLAACAYGTLWFVGAYASVVLLPHTLDADTVVLHNGVFASIACSRSDIAGARTLTQEEQRAAQRSNRIARLMQVPGKPMSRGSRREDRPNRRVGRRI
jgi:hypothetical protein